MKVQRRWRIPLLVGLALTVVCLVASWPACLEPTSLAVGGGGGDFNALAWTIWRATQTLPAPAYHHGDVQWPAGILLPPIALPQVWLMTPITLTLGPVASVNALQVLHVSLAGAFAAAWSLERGQRPLGAIVAGLTFGLSPVLLASVHNGNPDVTPIFWMPVVGLLVERGVTSVRSALGIALAIAFSTLWSPYVGVMTGLIGAVCGLSTPTRERWRLWLIIGVVAAAGFCVSASLYTGYPFAEGARVVVKRATTPVWPGSASLLGFIDPSVRGGGLDGWSEHRWYLGLVPLTLASLALRQASPKRTPLVLLGLGVLLAMGPTLQWESGPATLAGHHVALPGALWMHIPGLDGLRLVWRYAALGSLGLALLAAQGLEVLPRIGRATALALLMVDLLGFGEGFQALRSGPATDDGGCALLASRSHGPTISVPADHEERSLLAQTCHGMPVAGSLNRLPGRRVEAAISQGGEALRDLGFRWLLIDRSAPGAAGETARSLLIQLEPQVVDQHAQTALIDLSLLP